MATKRLRPPRAPRNRPAGRSLRFVARPALQAVPLPSHSWTFLSNHGHVLVVLAQNQNMPLREVSLQVGITERSVQRIASDLEEAGYITKVKVGRTNAYSINKKLPLRHPLEKHRNTGDLLSMIVG